MISSDLDNACHLALEWLPSRLFTRDWVRELRPPEKDIGDAAIILEVVSRTPAFHTKAGDLLLGLWRQSATQDILADALRRDYDSRLRSILAYSSFLRSGVVGALPNNDVLDAALIFCPRDALDSLALYYCQESVIGIPAKTLGAAIDHWGLVDDLSPFPVVPSIETAYSITHAFLYATDFGYSADFVSESFSRHIEGRMPRWMQHFMDLPDCDVCAELSAVASILGIPSWLRWARQLAGLQSSEGALFASCYDDEGLHTTLVGLLAWSTAIRVLNTTS